MELTDQWRDYRSRARWFVAMLLAGIPVVAIVITVSHAPSPSIGVWLLIAAWAIFLGVSALRLQFFPCPNCGKPFAHAWISRWPLSVKACVHCGLPKWEH
ncbi:MULTISPECIES: hypothetical protein [Pseudoxanthomonas]|jgi:hypothetical protein|uniref:Uncharacterized protein n=1 Tax=Pseudoxanthomonas winnipegensis TaxID=2480810 RepID=A0A4Q8LA49_9GAMM|nr:MULTISPECIES: hypothetical protein [Pseudoxanthomonas]TAA25512.1 hypothetical protein EA660_08640 [Pseudoxanthomonas winnipegensis]TMN16976.1 hypothetical protein FF950_17765 [Pseudoxanthomonas sp. X-1]UAY74996.1 hypothetical protein LAJ50_01585 [Pseudoxanthomonas sp. X-1]